MCTELKLKEHMRIILKFFDPILQENTITDKVIIDSYDGAIHTSIDSIDKFCNFFSSNIFDHNLLLRKKTSPANNSNLLTWCQFTGKE